jgi:hypothetical protein
VFPWYDAVVGGVPPCDRFIRLDELEATTDRLVAGGAKVRVWSPGRSRAGRAMRCVDIPGGPLEALLVALPHPEEPVGILMLAFEVAVEVRTRAQRLSAAGGIQAPPVRALVQCQVAALLCGLVAARDRYRPARPRPGAPAAGPAAPAAGAG